MSSTASSGPRDRPRDRNRRCRTRRVKVSHTRAALRRRPASEEMDLRRSAAKVGWRTRRQPARLPTQRRRFSTLAAGLMPGPAERGPTCRPPADAAPWSLPGVGSWARDRPRARRDRSRSMATVDAAATRIATVAAAATRTADLSSDGGADTARAVVVEERDLREAVREQRAANLVVLVVDASGSMGADSRIAAAKGAVVSLLVDAYERRDRVAMVTFREDAAEVALRPTGSVEVARARLDDLRTGGRTPLAAGIETGLGVALAAARGEHKPLIVLVSDGRATSGPDGADPLRAALEAAGRVKRMRVPSVVVDAEDGHLRLGLAATLAREMGARLVPATALTADGLAATVRGFLPVNWRRIIEANRPSGHGHRPGGHHPTVEPGSEALEHRGEDSDGSGVDLDPLTSELLQDERADLRGSPYRDPGWRFQTRLDGLLPHGGVEEARIEHVKVDTFWLQLERGTFGEPRQGSLRCDVRRSTRNRRTNRVRRNVEDVAAPARDHAGDDGQRARQWSDEIDPEDPLEDGAIVPGSRYAPIYPCDVGQEVDPVVLLLNLLKSRRKSIKVGQVTTNEPDPSEIRSIVNVDAHHLSSTRDEVLGQLPPDSRGGARHYRNMVGEIPHGVTHEVAQSSVLGYCE